MIEGGGVLLHKLHGTVRCHANITAPMDTVSFCHITVRHILLIHSSLSVLVCFLSSAIFVFLSLSLQALMDEILMLQDEIGELQTCFSEELADNDNDGKAGDQLALQSTLTVLGERMATIRMKASGKRQLLEVEHLPL